MNESSASTAAPAITDSSPEPEAHYQHALAALRDGAYSGLNAELQQHLITKLQHDLQVLQHAAKGSVPLPVCYLDLAP